MQLRASGDSTSLADDPGRSVSQLGGCEPTAGCERVRPGIRTPSAREDARTFFVYQLPALKGACILGVLTIHVAIGFKAVSADENLFWVLLFLGSLSRFAVPLFVLGSGFHLSLNERNERAHPFYRRTLRFLLVPFVAYSLLYTAIKLRSPAEIPSAIVDLFLGSAHYHLWYGLLVLQLYLLHPVLRRLYLAARHRGLLVVAVGVSQILWNVLIERGFPAFAASVSTASPEGQPWLASAIVMVAGRITRLAFVGYVGYFFAGYYLLDRAEEIGRLLERRSLLVCSVPAWLVSAVALACYWGIPMANGTPWAGLENPSFMLSVLGPVLSASAFICIMGWARSSNGLTRTLYRQLAAFGLYSYGIYYLHPLVLWLSARAVMRLVEPEPHGMPVFYMFQFAVAAILSLYLAKQASRLPFGRYLT